MTGSRLVIPLSAGTLLLVTLLLTGCGGPGGTAPTPGQDGDEPPDPPGAAEELSLPVDLYFPAPGGRLGVETREIPREPTPREQVRAVVEAVLAGPGAGAATGEPGPAPDTPAAATSSLVRPLPEDVILDGVYLGADGTAFLDLRTPEPREPPPMGSTEERQIVYSLVNSVALNMPQVRRVAILWNGRQRTTLGGHLDLSQPLAPSRELMGRRTRQATPARGTG